MNYLSPYAYRLKSPNWTTNFGDLEKQFESLFGDLPSLFDLGENPSLAKAATRVAARWYENEDAYQVQLDLPGVQRGDIEMSAEDGELSITAIRKYGEKEGKESSERYEKTVVLPEGVDADTVSASYENGVLAVTLPKSEKAKPRRIEVSFK